MGLGLTSRDNFKNEMNEGAKITKGALLGTGLGSHSSLGGLVAEGRQSKGPMVPDTKSRGEPSRTIRGRVVLVASSPWHMNWLLEQQPWHNWNPSSVVFFPLMI